MFTSFRRVIGLLSILIGTGLVMTELSPMWPGPKCAFGILLVLGVVMLFVFVRLFSSDQGY